MKSRQEWADTIENSPSKTLDGLQTKLLSVIVELLMDLRDQNEEIIKALKTTPPTEI